MVSKVEDGMDTNPAMFGQRGSGSRENNNLSIGRCRSSSNRFSSATNRATNALLKEKGLQLTSKSYTIFLKGKRRGWHIQISRCINVSTKCFEQAKEAAKHTKDTLVTAIKNVITACLGNAETVYSWKVFNWSWIH